MVPSGGRQPDWKRSKHFPITWGFLRSVVERLPAASVDTWWWDEVELRITDANSHQRKNCSCFICRLHRCLCVEPIGAFRSARSALPPVFVTLTLILTDKLRRAVISATTPRSEFPLQSESGRIWIMYVDSFCQPAYTLERRLRLLSSLFQSKQSIGSHHFDQCIQCKTCVRGNLSFHLLDLNPCYLHLWLFETKTQQRRKLCCIFPFISFKSCNSVDWLATNVRVNTCSSV